VKLATKILAIWGCIATIPLLCACYSVDSQGRKVAVRDGLPKGSAKGFAEFRLSLDSDVQSITVRRVGDRNLLGADLVQISGRRSASIRIAAPLGLQQFLIAGQARVTVPISEGMITPVELQVRTIGASLFRDTPKCQVSFRLSPPIQHTPIH